MGFHFRENLKNLIAKLKKEKEIIKRNGIKVDGKLYNVSFKGNQLYYFK